MPVARTLLAAPLLCASTLCAALDCARAVTTPDLDTCAAADHQRADAQLNAAYQRVLRTLGQGEEPPAERAAVQAALRDAQRLWVRFREADCKALYARDAGGSVRTLTFHGCMQARAEQRTRELQDYERP